jgi:carboxymethylenebutenolidase
VQRDASTVAKRYPIDGITTGTKYQVQVENIGKKRISVPGLPTRLICETAGSCDGGFAAALGARLVEMGEIVEFASNGATGQGYLATPVSGTGIPVVVIQEWWGLVPHIKSVCDRFAAEGFVALAPDLYHGRTVDEPDEAGKEMMALELDRAGRDMGGAVDELLRRTGASGVGVVGFCMGGGLALVLACQRPDAVRAVAPCYGIIPWPDAEPDYSAMTAAVEGHYAELDGFFTPEAANALGEKLRSLGKEARIVVHPGADHAFFNDERPEVYNAVEAQELWRSVVSFFSSRLDGSSA